LHSQRMMQMRSELLLDLTSFDAVSY